MLVSLVQDASEYCFFGGGNFGRVRIRNDYTPVPGQFIVFPVFFPTFFAVSFDILYADYFFGDFLNNLLYKFVRHTYNCRTYQSRSFDSQTFFFFDLVSIELFLVRSCSRGLESVRCACVVL